MFSVAILNSRFLKNARELTSMDNVVWDFHWLVQGLKKNVDVRDFRILPIVKSLIPENYLSTFSQE